MRASAFFRIGTVLVRDDGIGFLGPPQAVQVAVAVFARVGVVADDGGSDLVYVIRRGIFRPFVLAVGNARVRRGLEGMERFFGFS